MYRGEYYFDFQAEDAVCLADYCDIMRCEVIAAQENLGGYEGPNTDVELWRESTAYRTALTLTGPRDLARVDKSSVLVSLSFLTSGLVYSLQFK